MKIHDFLVKGLQLDLLNSVTIHEKKFHENLKKSTGVISNFCIKQYMVTKFNIRQQLAWQPEPAKKSEVEIPYQEGKILHNAFEELVERPNFIPRYSRKQLRAIKRRQSDLKYKQRNNQRSLEKKQSQMGEYS